ncbi:hypothetical protein [Chitinophaga pinensis]|uniref:Uncharacterized protein n=1 Tax=Chitinophaga pinensis (strain ATCC 43595 / DSM 2588 / LMG 13176 / NBRC 15968 / NCIMB 11800 / UQM 2034) TaxID=485918 RepID=A0A979GUC5_CHIPD|nr:hypothetical protein [Chitinophaga pinensis]ACU60694.1 hypothetical protein Cpin_3227 [Chitinophaga pinensis DSM 2588]
MTYLPLKTDTVYTLVYYGATEPERWCRDIVLTGVEGSYLIYHFRDEEVEGVVPDSRYLLSSQLITRLHYNGQVLPYNHSSQRIQVWKDFPQASGNKVLVWVDKHLGNLKKTLSWHGA